MHGHGTHKIILLISEKCMY